MRVIRLPIGEASAKVRTGGPKDDEEDMDMPIWAGVIPMRTSVEAPVADVGLPDGVNSRVRRALCKARRQDCLIAPLDFATVEIRLSGGQKCRREVLA